MEYQTVFMNIDNYECYKYYGYYGDNLLNSEYLMLGLNDVVRNKDLIKRCLSDNSNENIFIRPSNGYKTFTGQLISYNNIENDINNIMKSYGGINPETLVLISKEQEIEEEYRFIVIDGEVITGSLYMDKNNRSTYKAYYNKPINGGEVFDFAVKMLKIHNPDKAFTIDICKTKNNEYKILEINSFNCASMYGADYDKIVKATNKLAIKEYNDLFDI